MWKVTAVAVLGSFLSQMDATVVNVSLSTLARDLHSTLGLIQWVASGYLLALALMLPLNAWMVDRIGAKQLYLWCFSTFTVSSALCGLAWSARSLIAFRVLQGMSGGLLAPMAQMMVARVAGKQMARLMGYAALVVLLAPILGPVIAGAILQHASWRWLFLINLPIGSLGILMAAVVLPSDTGMIRPRAFDLSGFLLLSPGLVLFLYGADHISEGSGLVFMALATILLVFFVRTAAHKGKQALVDVRLFRHGSFPAASVTQFLGNGVSFAGQLLVPYFLIQACGRSTSTTGWLLAPLGLGMLSVYPFMGYLTKRFGLRPLAASGAALAFAATLPLLYLAHHGLVVLVLAVALFFRGVGLSTIGVPSMTAAYSSVPKQDLPMATTSLNIVQRLGGPTLTTLCATFLAWELRTVNKPGSPQAFVAVFSLLCAFHALAFAASLRLPASLETSEPVEVLEAASD